MGSWFRPLDNDRRPMIDPANPQHAHTACHG
jgi:hypothetical protein